MRLLGRLTAHSLTVLSLLLCLATGFVWVRSYYVRDIAFFGRTGGHTHMAQSLLGRLHVITDLDSPYRESEPISHYQSDRLSPQAIWNGGMSGYPVNVQWRFGFVFQNYTRTYFSFSIEPSSLFTTRHRLVVVPYWAPAALFAVMPAAWLAWRVSRRRFGAGLCAKCGYDLRASPERCPECGAEVESPRS